MYSMSEPNHTASIEYTEKKVFYSNIAGIKKFWRENKSRDLKFADISEADRLRIKEAEKHKKKKKFYKTF